MSRKKRVDFDPNYVVRDGFDVWKPEGGCVIKAWVKGVQFETEAMEQVQRVAKLPFVSPHIAVMPDVHAGIGATVGSVVATEGAIIPAAVGVDIGCGMRFALTNLTVSDLDPALYPEIRSQIERRVPHGRTDNGGANDRGAWGRLPPVHMDAWLKVSNGYARIWERDRKLLHEMAGRQLGTLGTGNHFLEVCLDEKDRVWLVVHSGSRGVGARIGNVFVKTAKSLMEKWFIKLEDPHLAYLPEDTAEFQAYIDAVEWAQDYAYESRRLMLLQAMVGLSAGARVAVGFAQEDDCHHNYLARENHFGRNVWVTRKGAVRARVGDVVIIPGSMGARSYIVEGLGNPDSLTSCSHGAGRRMSRTEAKKTFTVEDHIKATAGVECRKDAEVIDETPGSYKNIDAVMEAQKDLVKIVHTLKQIICIKG